MGGGYASDDVKCGVEPQQSDDVKSGVEPPHSKVLRTAYFGADRLPSQVPFSLLCVQVPESVPLSNLARRM